MPDSLSPDLLRKMHAYWRAANYLSVGQIYLQDNPLLETPLKLEHVKPRLLGHWGTTTGLNFLYVHLNRLIKDNDLNMIYVIGPGSRRSRHCSAQLSRRLIHRAISRRSSAAGTDCNGCFDNFPGHTAFPSHVSPETPGSIHEGGELGYSLAHAYGAAFDNPDLIVSCIIGDGEAETGALATSWHSNKFLNPGPRWRGASDPSSERVQDRQSDGAGPHQPSGTDRAVAWLRLRSAFRRGRRSCAGASKSCRDARQDFGSHSSHPEHRPLSAAERPAWSARAGR